MKPIDYAGLLEDKDDECLELRKKLEKAEAKLKTTAKDLAILKELPGKLERIKLIPTFNSKERNNALSEVIEGLRNE